MEEVTGSSPVSPTLSLPHTDRMVDEAAAAVSWTGPGLLLIRHRRSTYNDDGLWTGRHDPPLSARGREEAEQVRRGLADCDVDRAVVSDLRRTRETADVMLGDRVPLVPVTTEVLLGELDSPAWAGLTRGEIERWWPGALAGWREGTLRDLPQAESWEAFRARVLLGLARAADLGARVLVVAHAGVLLAAGEALGSEHGKVARSRGLWLTRTARGGLRAGPLQRLQPTSGRDQPSAEEDEQRQAHQGRDGDDTTAHQVTLPHPRS